MCPDDMEALLGKLEPIFDSPEKSYDRAPVGRSQLRRWFYPAFGCDPLNAVISCARRLPLSLAGALTDPFAAASAAFALYLRARS